MTIKESDKAWKKTEQFLKKPCTIANLAQKLQISRAAAYRRILVLQAKYGRRLHTEKVRQGKRGPESTAYCLKPK